MVQEVANPPDGVLEERKHQHLTFLRFVDSIDGLTLGLLRDFDQRVGQRTELGIAIRRDGFGLAREFEEQIPVPLHRGAETRHIVEGGIAAMCRSGEHILEHRVVVRGQFPHELRGNDVAGRERVEEHVVLARHLADGTAECEGRGLEPLQYARAQQANHCTRSGVFFAVTGSEPVGIRRVAGEGDGIAAVGVERGFQPVEESGQQVVKVVAYAGRSWLREHDRLWPTIRVNDVVAGIVLLHELPRALHRGRIDDGIKEIRAQTRRILSHRTLEPFANRKNTPVREVGVLADEEAYQVVDIPE